MEPSERRNRLAREKSPYLLQHAGNPVDWYAWGEEPFRKARDEEKPIFLSIGYATCHWCHVMERESFEDEETAALLNSHFVAIKVDREERPDVDAVYMAAVQAMGGQGGWPLSVFLTPDGRPYYGGTYFPPTDRWGRPGFPRVLASMAEAYRSRRGEVLASAEEIRRHLASVPLSGGNGDLSEQTLHLAGRQFADRFDSEHGGFETAPKFPRPHGLSLLLRLHARTGEAQTLAMVEKTLTAMARGGIRDHLGGGFHRYSTDREWLVPHFEKMLYDQALLSLAFVEASLVTGRRDFAAVARETLCYVLRDLREAGGAFASAEDADSEGVEGKFYVFRRTEVREALGEAPEEDFAREYGLSESGNFRDEASNRATGANIPHLPGPGSAAGDDRFAAAREALLHRREARVRPLKDDKILADWNGLAIAALAYAGRALPEESFTEAAARAASFVLDRMVEEGRLLHRYRDGEAGIPGFLDDYAFLAWGLLELYEATFEPRWLAESLQLARETVRLFRDPESGGFFTVASDGEKLIAPVKEIYDGAIPSGNSVAAFVLARLARTTGDGSFAEEGWGVLRAFAASIARQPQAFPFAAMALDELLGPSREIVLAGDPRDERLHALAGEVSRRFLPRTALVLRPSGPGARTLEELVPGAAGKGPVSDAPAAFVCADFACRAPVTSAGELADLL
ncbi:MAG: thioredoxin domain-containing protein [Planctomycetes bacterium]|jgi:hypothetical protein|nr:thioredoxin domain-containing protein [Planctomycetota bacterium]